MNTRLLTVLLQNQHKYWFAYHRRVECADEAGAGHGGRDGEGRDGGDGEGGGEEGHAEVEGRVDHPDQGGEPADPAPEPLAQELRGERGLRSTKNMISIVQLKGPADIWCPIQ